MTLYHYNFFTLRPHSSLDQRLFPIPLRPTNKAFLKIFAAPVTSANLPHQLKITLLEMARKKCYKFKEETRVSSMFPLFHHAVVNAISDELTWTWFHKGDSNDNYNNNYSTHVMASSNAPTIPGSIHSWHCKKMAILIRGYPGNGYNAPVHNQPRRTRNRLGRICDNEKSYVDRVAYRLDGTAILSLEGRSTT